MYLKEYKPDLNRLRHPISQSGRGLSVNRYIYNQQRGAGIGNFFSKLFRTVIPAAIKGGARILKPHAEKIARQALTVGSEIAANKVNEISNNIQSNLNKARPKKRPPKTDRKPKKRRKDLRPPKTDRKPKRRKDLFNAKISRIR